MYLIILQLLKQCVYNTAQGIHKTCTIIIIAQLLIIMHIET